MFFLAGESPALLSVWIGPRMFQAFD